MNTRTDEIKQRAATLLKHIEELAANQQHGSGQVRLIAVTKTRPVATIKAAYNAGLKCFGENRVQELAEKAPSLPSDIEWHMIGHLQRNKVRHAVRLSACIHSVDSLELLHRIDRVAGEESRHPAILLQINLSGEDTKSGASPEEGTLLATAALNCRNLQCKGLMTMAPYHAGEEELHDIFAGLRKLRDRIASETDLDLPELSMGMSNDYEAAIAEGATMVRIGSALFG